MKQGTIIVLIVLAVAVGLAFTFLRTADADYKHGCELFEHKQYDAAIRTLRPLVSGNHKNALQALCMVGLSYQRQNDFANAKKCYAQLLSKYPKQVTRLGLGNLAEVAGFYFEKIHDYPVAVKWYSMAASAAEKNSDNYNYAITRNMHERLAMSYHQSKDWQKAISAYQEIANIFPDDMAWALERTRLCRARLRESANTTSGK